ncbi:MAG: translation elongation factor Ts [Phycisphaerales bacterium]|nr:translation elongation factor Ts [Phycisphaerales bacterium]
MSTANIDAKTVMALRNRTGLGFGDCRNALAEVGSDLEKAEALLRDRLKGKMDNRTDRPAGEGCISIAINGANATIVEIRSETDFTAKNDEFRAMASELASMALAGGTGAISMSAPMTAQLDTVRIKTGENISFAKGTHLVGGSFAKYIHHDGKLGVLLQYEGTIPDDLATGICQHIAAAVPAPMSVDEHGLPAEIVAAKRDEARKEALESGKPANIVEKMAEGRLRKFFEETTLLGQKYVRDDKVAIGKLLPAGVKITTFVRMRVGG